MIKFSKYHGCGNNFIIVREKDIDFRDYQSLAVSMCSIKTGIGADGLIIVREEPELEMVFYNMDGSRAPMCGNGIRCFAAYCCHEGIRTEKKYPVKTLAGDMIINVVSEEPFKVTVDMGKPLFRPETFGVADPADDFINRILTVEDKKFTVTSMFMGTVHTVCFTDEFPDEKTARSISEHPVFSEKTNANFVKIIDRENFAVKTYERGVGFTSACGTGACACLVAGHILNLCEDRVSVHLEYGTLDCRYEKENIMMTGPAAKIAQGTYIQEDILK